MFTFLKNHPFAVEAFFDSSIVLTFAVPKKELEPLIPECLELDTFNDEWAFIAMAMVQTKNLRPKGFPEFMGNDFFLIGYRVFVKYRNKEGKRLRGLYILKSETDKKKMEFLGNLFTHYNYTTTDINIKSSKEIKEYTSAHSNFKVTLGNLLMEEVELPFGTPFADWKQARRFAGPLPLPFTFTYDSKSKKVLIIQGVREDWEPKPLEVKDYKISFIDSLNLTGVKLANAFIVNDINYMWKKGKLEAWKN